MGYFFAKAFASTTYHGKPEGWNGCNLMRPLLVLRKKKHASTMMTTLMG